MTDAHCHVTGGDPSVREFLIGRDFFGIHPWEAAGEGLESLEKWLREKLTNPSLSNLSNLSNFSNFSNFSNVSNLPNFPNLLPGVGEIGLDRLKEKSISPRMREVFEVQLKLALEFNRPVVLHGAKCWGQVVETVRRAIEESNDPKNRTIPSFLFHGFSRSDGLIPDIVKLNGYISVGPAVLNDHAVNYRELVKKIPSDRLLLETDRTPENATECPSVREVADKVAELRGVAIGELERTVDANAAAFAAGGSRF